MYSKRCFVWKTDLFTTPSVYANNRCAQENKEKRLSRKDTKGKSKNHRDKAGGAKLSGAEGAVIMALKSQLDHLQLLTEALMAKEAKEAKMSSDNLAKMSSDNLAVRRPSVS